MWKKLITIIISLFILGGVFLFSEASIPDLKKTKIQVDEKEKVVIGVLADTHIPARADKIPGKVLNTFRNRKVDLILHAGDLVEKEVTTELETISPIIAVKGNMDPPNLDLPKGIVIEIKGFRIGMIHNTINPLSNKMEKLAKKENLDLIIFGHTHRSKLEKKNKIWYMNPGSPTQPIMDKASFGIVEINKEIEPELITI